MTTIHRYTNDYPKISRMVSDGGDYVWIAYEKDSDGVCHVQKVSANALDQVYFDLEVEAERIVDMEANDNQLYVLLGNSTYLAIGYGANDPLTNITTFARPATMLEEPVALCIDDGNDVINILLPGSSSATNAIVYRFNTSSAILIETIAVRVANIRIVEARDISLDANDNLWIVTYTNPTKLIRMWFASGGWKFAFTNIT